MWQSNTVFKSSLIFTGNTGEWACHGWRGCFCARWCTKGLIAVLRVALDLFWIFSSLCGSLFITACIRQSLLCQALHSALPIGVGERSTGKPVHCESDLCFASVSVLSLCWQDGQRARRRAACGIWGCLEMYFFSLRKREDFLQAGLTEADKRWQEVPPGPKRGRGGSVRGAGGGADGRAQRDAPRRVGLQLRPRVNTVISCALPGR